ncbi:DUF3795 domain-containing protein [bacterium]|nr:DUF3795 domain-containing protein [bacterium]
MEKILAFCGIMCSSCPAYIATQEDDDEKRRKIVDEWNSKEFPLKLEDINCDGCLPFAKKLLPFCNECTVRICALDKGVENCAYCDDYPCQKLEFPWSMAKDAKDRLDDIRKTLGK